MEVDHQSPLPTPGERDAGSAADAAILCIGDWQLDPRANELRRGDEVVRLERKVIDVLSCLASSPGRVVTRDELLTKVWPAVVVGDDVLTQAVIKLRKALGDDPREPRYISTIPKRGYRLLAPVGTVEPGADEPVPLPAPNSFTSHPEGLVPAPEAGTGAAQEIRPRWTAVRLGMAAGVSVVAAVGWMWADSPAGRVGFPGAVQTGPTEAAVPIVAVLPLVPSTVVADRDYFSDGFTEDLINALGRFSGLRVMSFGAVLPYKGRTASPVEVGHSLGAHYVVQGSLRQADARLRLTVSLSDTRSGTLLGSETYDGADLELFEIQERAVRQIVARLHLRVTQVEQQRALTKPTGSLESHDLLLRARALVARVDRGANRQAREMLSRALELDPNYDDARTVLGEAEFQRAARGWVEDAATSVTKAEGLARQVLASVDTRAHARAHALLALILNHQGNYRLAMVQADRALALNPSDPGVLYQRAAASLSLGQVDEAIRLHETARRFEPRPLTGERLSLGLALFTAGRYADAVAETELLLTNVPDHAHAQALKAAALARSGRVTEARLVAEAVKRSDPLFDADSFGTRFEDPAHTALLRDSLRAAGL